jgi:hypothetical protein
MADLPRKNCWVIAEHAGDATPDGMQHFLAAAAWDADAVPDDLRGEQVTRPIRNREAPVTEPQLA